DNTLHGVSWGSRRFYRWTLGSDGRVTNAHVPPEVLSTANTSHYLDYQDCKYGGARRMLCTGLTELHHSPAAPPLRLGGIALADLRSPQAECEDGRPRRDANVLVAFDRIGHRTRPPTPVRVELPQRFAVRGVRGHKGAAAVAVEEQSACSDHQTASENALSD